MERTYLLVRWNANNNPLYIQEISYSKISNELSVIYTQIPNEALTVDNYSIATLTCEILQQKDVLGFTTLMYQK